MMNVRQPGILIATLLALVTADVTAGAEDFVFETPAVRYAIGDDGASRSLRDKTSGRELLAGMTTPFAALRKSGAVHPVTRVRRRGDVLQADFGQSGVSADYRITAAKDYLVTELVRWEGASPAEFRLLQLHAGGLANAGTLLGVLWDEQAAISLLGLSDRVDSRFADGMLMASVYPEYGMAGERVALIVGPTRSFTDIVQKTEEDNGLPSPKIGGIWAKRSPDVRGSYLFIDLTEANADEIISLAKSAGFKYIMIYSHIWSSSPGSYPVNVLNFPRGEASLRRRSTSATPQGSRWACTY